ANGMTLISAHLPGRPLLVAHLLLDGEGSGATGEPADQAGATVLMARAMTEGTANHDAVSLIEASERLGAEVSADAGWDSLAVSVDVPRSRLAPALALLAEVALQPSFPADEVERLREERLNDLLQARAEPRRRVERAFAETIYAEDAAYRRSMGGMEATVPGITRGVLVARHASVMRPSKATMLIAGDLSGIDVEGLVRESLGDWSEPSGPAPIRGVVDSAVPGARRIVVVDRPGSPQSELRIGHLGVPRRDPDFHAISVLNALLGGLFGSRLNALLREEKGYTYGVHSSFDMRVGSGPFAVRTAVQTEFTVPSVVETLGELQRIREGLVTLDELTIARDYLVGVFPLRYETSGQVAGAIAGMVAHGLPDDEFDRYRPAIAAITAEQVLAAAQRHIRPEEASVVIVGDADAFVPALEAAGIGDVQVVREEVPEDAA
ncbi:MAG: insulinase family protein, partial [Chloroflexi bacterium]|nr:insulinase family protein [Chloroflexota bacterium]